MKKYLLIPAIAILALACNKSGGKGAVVPVDDTSPVPVTFRSNLEATVTTKGDGVLDSWDGTQDIYVYGLSRDDEGKYLIPAPGSAPYDGTNPNAYLINNEKASSPDSGDSGAIYVYNPQSPNPQEYFFYAEGRKYSFYAYYVDDAANPIVPTATTEAIQLPVTIDGTQDIMVAKTDPAKDILGTGVSVDRAYSAYSARRSVVPNLVFEHQLSRFNFKVKAGNPETEQQVVIKSLSVKSKTKGTLVIATNDESANHWGLTPDPTDPGSDIPVIIPANHHPVYYDPQVNPNPSIPVFGDPVMVMPGEQVYDLTLIIGQADYTGGDFKVDNLKIHFAPQNPEDGKYSGPDAVADKGNSYDVTIVVYGLHQVDVNVTLTAWDNSHGSFELDPDV